jgi:hypothetical protein
MHMRISFFTTVRLRRRLNDFLVAQVGPLYHP